MLISDLISARRVEGFYMWNRKLQKLDRTCALEQSK